MIVSFTYSADKWITTSELLKQDVWSPLHHNMLSRWRLCARIHRFLLSTYQLSRFQNILFCCLICSTQVWYGSEASSLFPPLVQLTPFCYDSALYCNMAICIVGSTFIYGVQLINIGLPLIIIGRVLIVSTLSTLQLDRFNIQILLRSCISIGWNWIEPNQLDADPLPQSFS